MEYIYKNRANSKLLIFFLGWSCDANSIEGVEFEGYDTLFIYNYTSIEIDIDSIVSTYTERYLIGWSFGVWAANSWAAHRGDINGSIAINGTPVPVDDKYGITHKIFNFTLKNIKRHGIESFNERMCGEDIADFRASKRSFEDQYRELELLGERAIEPIISDFLWSYAIVGRKDLIFPTQNIIEYWNKNSKFAPIIAEITHYPFSDRGIKLITRVLKDVTIR